MLRLLILGALFLALLAPTGAVARPGGGHGGGHAFAAASTHGNGHAFGRASAFSTVGAPVDASTRFSSTFPRGNAWGLRRRLGLSNATHHGRFRSASDGDTITRAGRTWQFDASQNAWLIVP